MIFSVLTLLFLVWPAAAPDRPQDREEIRAHIDRIFQAFIHKDDAELRATHDANWLGYLEGSRTSIHGLDAYMKATGGHWSPEYGMTGYAMREFDMIFEGNAAFVNFIADIDYKTPSGPLRRTLRITDFYAKRDGHWIQAGSDTDEAPYERYLRAGMPQELGPQDKKSLLEARERVWRAFFSNDRTTLEKLIPEETRIIDGVSGIGTRAQALEGSAGLAKAGIKLASLDFPSTEIQCYGNTAILYSTYRYELLQGEKTTTQEGRITEVFVNRKGEWVNPGWHMQASNR